jgi:hypothetical protein
MGKKEKKIAKFFYVFASQLLANMEYAHKEFWRIRRMHVKSYGINGECASRILLYMEYA